MRQPVVEMATKIDASIQSSLRFLINTVIDLCIGQAGQVAALLAVVRYHLLVLRMGQYEQGCPTAGPLLTVHSAADIQDKNNVKLQNNIPILLLQKVRLEYRKWCLPVAERRPLVVQSLAALYSLAV